MPSAPPSDAVAPTSPLELPDSPGLLERTAGRLHLPFVLLAALLALIVSVPGVPAVLPGIGQVGGSLGGAVGTGAGEILAKIFLFCLVFYIILIRPQIRRRTQEVGPQLPHRRLGPVGFFADVAKRSQSIRISSTAALISVTGLAVVLVILEPPTSGAYTWYALPLYLFLTLLRWLAYAACVYAFVVVAWSMYDYSRKPYPIASFFDDPTLGLSPLGALTLSLVTYYVIFLALLTLYASFSGNGALTFGVAGVLAALGAVMFYLPLRAMHVRMEAEKRSILVKTRKMVETEVKGIDLGSAGQVSSNPVNLLALDVIERRVEAIRTWPFDTGPVEALLGRLVVPVGLAATAGLLLHFGAGI